MPRLQIPQVALSYPYFHFKQQLHSEGVLDIVRDLLHPYDTLVVVLRIMLSQKMDLRTIVWSMILDAIVIVNI